MPKPGYRTTLLKKQDKKLPGGRTTTHYKKKRVKQSPCALCKRPLAGVPKLPPSELKKLPKTQRRPNRPYGGVLCPDCLREILKQAARME